MGHCRKARNCEKEIAGRNWSMETGQVEAVGGKNGRSEYVTQGRNRYLYTAHSNCLVAFSSF